MAAWEGPGEGAHLVLLGAYNHGSKMLVNRILFLDSFKEESLPELFCVPGAWKDFRECMISEAEYS